MAPRNGTLPHDRSECLVRDGVNTELFEDSIRRWFHAALKDDDIEQVPSSGAHVGARVIAKQDGILAGRRVLDAILSGTRLECNWFIEDGEPLDEGVILELKGPADSILALERPMLNVIGRLSGIATNTSRWVSAASCPVACTRKTTWGLLDKWAVHVGGGLTHRLSRTDALMIKENDIAVMDSIESALDEVNPAIWAFVEIEVRNREEVLRAASAWNHQTPLVIMLDNMSHEECRGLRNHLDDERFILEASGGITFDSLKNWNDVDVVSSSALNQGVSHVDFSMLMEGA